MPYPFAVVDAFTDQPFSGNPAGVYVLDAPQSAEWMGRVAREMNQAETAFLVREGAGFRLRWFSPTVEVPLCGHGTLASAHTLWERGIVAADAPIEFYTLSGTLGASRTGQMITLDFPRRDVTAVADPPAALLAAIGAPVVGVWRDPRSYLLELADAAAVRALTPDIAAIKSLPMESVVVSAAGDGAGIDFVSRNFCPAIGINEDPVTGATHCLLAPFWAARLGRDALVGYQASARGGTVRVQVVGDRVRLSGHAITTLRGDLQVD